MEFTLSVARKRNGLWEHIRGSIDLDIVNTDQLADFQLTYAPGESYPCFFQTLPSATRDAQKELVHSKEETVP